MPRLDRRVNKDFSMKVLAVSIFSSFILNSANSF